MDGRGVAAVLVLGAAGAALGTRFLLAREAATPSASRTALLAATELDTVVSNRWTGRQARGLRSRVVEALEQAGVEALPWPFQRVAAADLYAGATAQGDAGLYPVLAGQGLRLLTDGEGAAEIVEELVAQARERLSSF